MVTAHHDNGPHVFSTLIGIVSVLVGQERFGNMTRVSPMPQWDGVLKDNGCPLAGLL